MQINELGIYGSYGIASGLLYNVCKSECKEQIEKLEDKLSKDGSDAKKINIDKSLDRALQYVDSIPKIYREGEVRTRRDTIG